MLSGVPIAAASGGVLRAAVRFVFAAIDTLWL